MAHNYRNTLAAWAFALAASLSFGADKRTIVNEDFEKGADCAAFSGGLFQKQFLKPVSGAEALSGGGSALAEARERENILVVKKLKPNAVYLFRLAYKIESFGKNGRTAFTVSVKSGGKTPPFSAPNLSFPVLGRKLAMKEGYRIPDDGKEYQLAITLNAGARVYFDDIRIDEIVPDARNGYLFCQPHDHRDIFADKEFPGMYYSPTAYSFLDPDSPILDMPREKFFPFIDKWGQYKYSEWPNKIKSDEQLKAMEKLEREHYLKNPKPAARDKYGALENSRGGFKPTGRFCLDKVDGKWILRAPNGNLFWAFALNSVGISNSATPIGGREHFFDDLSDEFGCIIRTTQYPILHYPPDAKLKVANLKLRTYMWKYGLKTYNEALAKSKEICDWRMSNWGVPAYGAWAAPNLLENPAHPYIVICNSPKQLCARNCHLNADPSVRKLFRMVPDVCDPRFRKYV
ncbi:MAG: hypothetical protein IJI37_00675, partial [Opitutales bacterium]|nr:hypothetical protein [Opitutales bacterium]